MTKVTTACIIDDDEIYTFAVKRIIATSAIVSETLFFPNGKLALDFFKENISHPENLPDLILLDINMPILDGWQFMDEFIKIEPSIHKKISIYIISSSVDEADKEKARTYHQIVDFIVKPITAAQLRELVMKIE